MPGAHFGELISCEVGKYGCLFRGPDLRAREFLFPKLLRCMLTTVGSAPFAILRLSAVWLLMRFLTLQRIANPTVVGTIAQTGGVVILAVTSILIWLGCVRVRPLHRIRAILFTAAFSKLKALTNARRGNTGRAARPRPSELARRPRVQSNVLRRSAIRAWRPHDHSRAASPARVRDHRSEPLHEAEPS